MEENGKKWKKSVVDVQIEGVLVRSCLDSGNDFISYLYLDNGDLVLMVGMIVGMFFIFIVKMILYLKWELILILFSIIGVISYSDYSHKLSNLEGG